MVLLCAPSAQMLTGTCGLISHFCFICTSISRTIVSGCPSAVICHMATKCNEILKGRFNPTAVPLPSASDVVGKNVSLKSSMQKKVYPLTLINTCWTFKEIEERMWTQQVSEWCVSAVMIVTGHLCWCTFLQVWHARLLFMGDNSAEHSGDYVEKWCFVPENLIYKTVLLCSSYLL